MAEYNIFFTLHVGSTSWLNSDLLHTENGLDHNVFAEGYIKLFPSVAAVEAYAAEKGFGPHIVTPALVHEDYDPEDPDDDLVTVVDPIYGCPNCRQRSDTSWNTPEALEAFGFTGGVKMTRHTLVAGMGGYNAEGQWNWYGGEADHLDYNWTELKSEHSVTMCHGCGAKFAEPVRLDMTRAAELLLQVPTEI